MRDFEEELRTIVVDVLGVKPQDVTRDATLAALGMDSLDAVSLSIEVEGEFGIEQIPDTAWPGLETFGALVDYVAGKAEQ